VTREAALEALRALALGLAPVVAGTARLMQRTSQHEEAETLRAALVEEGARTLLDPTPCTRPTP
jgi:hypothetical protein